MNTPNRAPSGKKLVGLSWGPVVLVVAALIGGCASSGETPSPGSAVCRSGTFFRTIGDPSAGGSPTVRYSLELTEGGTAALVMTPQVLSESGGATSLQRRSVEVKGTLESSDPDRINVTEIQQLEGGDTPCA